MKRSNESVDMTKPDDILDREAEWQDLLAAWESPGPEVVFVLGRRRAGKSFLLSRFVREIGGVYYQATKRTGEEQLSRLTRVVGECLGDSALASGAGFPDWEALLGYLTDRSGGAQVLVLDEFPYLAAAEPALPSILQTFIDHRWRNMPFKLVLCGSLITAMQRLEEQDQPLYGRRTCRIDVAPFAYFNAAGFLPSCSVRDRLLAYGMVGGLPGHLDLLNPDLSLEENVCRTVLSASGRLSDEAQHTLDAFVEDAGVHYSIVAAIANGERTWRGITNRVGKSGGSVLRPLEWLMGMDIVERVVPIDEARPDRSRKSLYRITDPYVAFWHRFVSPLAAAGSIGLVEPSLLWRKAILPRLNDHMGDIFEQICREFVRHTTRLPFQPVRIGKWWSPDGREEIDIAALGSEGELLACECKWGTVTVADVDLLRRRAHLLAARIPGARQIHLAVFSGQDPADPVVRAAVESQGILFFGLPDIAQPVA